MGSELKPLVSGYDLRKRYYEKERMNNERYLRMVERKYRSMEERRDRNMKLFNDDEENEEKTAKWKRDGLPFEALNWKIARNGTGLKNVDDFRDLILTENSIKNNGRNIGKGVDLILNRIDKEGVRNISLVEFKNWNTTMTYSLCEREVVPRFEETYAEISDILHKIGPVRREGDEFLISYRNNVMRFRIKGYLIANGGVSRDFDDVKALLKEYNIEYLPTNLGKMERGQERHYIDILTIFWSKILGCSIRLFDDIRLFARFDRLVRLDCCEKLKNFAARIGGFEFWRKTRLRSVFGKIENVFEIVRNRLDSAYYLYHICRYGGLDLGTLETLRFMFVWYSIREVSL
jgi:hypothetical protein